MKDSLQRLVMTFLLTLLAWSVPRWASPQEVTPPEIQRIMAKAQSGQKLTAEEKQTVNAWIKAMAGPALSAVGTDAPPEVQRILAKRQAGERLTPEEGAMLNDWAAREAAAEVSRVITKVGQPGAPQGTSPTELQRIIQKAVAGGRLTPDEKQALRGWRGSVSHGKGTLAAATLPMFCPTTKPALATLPSAAPTEDEYLRLVHAWSRTYGAKAGRAKARLDAAFEHAKSDGDASDLGVFLLGLRAGAAGTYAIAWTAQRAPTDPVAANNLGVALKGMKDYPGAASALLYADRLFQDTPLIVANRGWLLFDLGDLAGARELFERSARLDPGYSSAEMGLGLVALCGGDAKAAAKHLRQSLDGDFSSTAATALEAADAAAADAGDHTNGARPIQPTDQQAGPPEEQTGQDGSGSHDGEEAGAFTLPDPAVTASIPEEVAAIAGMAQVYQSGTQRSFELKQQLAAEPPPEARANPLAGLTVYDGRPLTMTRSYDYEVFLLRDLERIYIAGKSRPLYEEFNGAIRGIEEGFSSQLAALTATMRSQIEACGHDDRCTQQALYTLCQAARELAQAKHPPFVAAWDHYWTATKTALIEYHDHSAGILKRIADPALSQHWNRVVEANIVDRYTLGLGWVMTEASALAAAWQPTCTPPPKPKPFKGRIKVYPVQGATCPTGKGNFGLIFVYVEWDCDKIKIGGGEGVVGELTLDWSKGPLVIKPFIGFGLKGSLGPVLSAGAKEGFVVNIPTGNANWDVGVKGSVEAKATVPGRLGDPTGTGSENMGGLNAGVKVTCQLMAAGGPDLEVTTPVRIGKSP